MIIRIVMIVATIATIVLRVRIAMNVESVVALRIVVNVTIVICASL